MRISHKAYENAIVNLHECKMKCGSLKSYPLKLYIEPTSICNLNCTYCVAPEFRVKQELDMKIFYALREQLFDYCCEVNLFLRGEPTLAEHFPEMLDICSEYPFITKFFSNLSYRNDSILEKMVQTGSWVNVSFDGLEDSNQMRTGINLDFVINNIKYLIACQERIKNPKFHLRLAVVVSKVNIKNAINVLNWAASMNIREVMYGCVDAYHKLQSDLLTSEDAPYFNAIMQRADELKIRVSTPSHIGGVKLEKSSNWRDFTLPIDDFFPHFVEDCNPDVKNHFCPYPWLQTVIQADGEVVSCCQRKIHIGYFEPEMDFIREIWNNQNYIDLRARKDFRECKDEWSVHCGLVNYSIWGGELRLRNIPESMPDTSKQHETI